MFKEIEMTGQNKEEAIRKALAELGADLSEVKVEVLDEGEQGGFLGFGRRPAVVRVTDQREAASSGTDMESVTDEDSSWDEDGESSDSSVNAHASDDEDGDDLVDSDAGDDEEETAPEEDTVSDEDADTDLESKKAMIEETIREFLLAVNENLHLDNEVTVGFEGKTLVADIDGNDCGILIGRRGATLRSMQYLTSLYTNRLAGTRVELRMDIGGYRRKREDSVSDLATRTAEKALRTGNAFELNPMGSNDRRIVHETLANTEGIVTYSEGEEPRRYVVIDLEAAMPDDFDSTSTLGNDDISSYEEQNDGGEH